MTATAFRFATVSGQRIDWYSMRRSTWTPAQLGSACALSCVGAWALGLGLWMHGLPLEALGAGVGMGAVGLVLAVWARHAQDAEIISLQGARLVVERVIAGRHERAEFDRLRVRVEPKASDRSLITLSAQGRTVDVGRFMAPELRRALASEIRRALRVA